VPRYVEVALCVRARARVITNYLRTKESLALDFRLINDTVLTIYVVWLRILWEDGNKRCR